MRFQFQMPTPMLVLFVLCWFVSYFSFGPMEKIESQAIHQPDHPVGEYTQPLDVKGHIRYLTKEQERTNDLAHRGFIGGWLGGVASFFIGAIWALWRSRNTSKA